MDILADIFYISNFTKMGHSTMQIFYENGLVDNLAPDSIWSYINLARQTQNQYNANSCQIVIINYIDL